MTDSMSTKPALQAFESVPGWSETVRKRLNQRPIFMVRRKMPNQKGLIPSGNKTEQSCFLTETFCQWGILMGKKVLLGDLYGLCERR